MIAQPVDEVVELGFGFGGLDLVGHLERHRHHGPAVVAEGRVREQDEVGAAGQPAHDLRGGLLARELAEELFDVLDFEGALLEVVLGDVIFHQLPDFWASLAQVSRSDTMRLNMSAPGRDSGSTEK